MRAECRGHLPERCAPASRKGKLAVPLNTLLQHRRYTLLSAGRSTAVQGFN